MKKIFEKIKVNQNSIKMVFFLSVSMIVVLEMSKLLKTISWTELKNTLGQLSPLAIFLMFLFGLLALTPMLFFDIILNREIKSQHSRSYILETSWIINSINNLVGFAGLVDIGLRYSFYSEDKKTGDSMQAISKVMPFFVTGLSLLSGFSLVSIFIFPTSPSIQKFWLILVGAFLYLPVILFFSSHQKLKYFGQVSPITQFQLLLASSFDWLGIVSFFIFIGRVLGLSVPLYNIIPLFFISMTLGMLSMIPGGLGSFDLIMTAGLVNLGCSTGKVITWILLFRLFYYIIPFLFGASLFFKQMGGKINNNYLGIPKTIILMGIQHIVVLFLRLFGYFMILSALIPDEISEIKYLNHLNPIQGHLLWQFPSVIIGILFFLLARFVRNKLSFSIPFGVGLFLVTLIYVNLGSLSIPTSTFLIIALLLVLTVKGSLDRKYFTYSWEDRTKDALIMVFTFVTFFLVGGRLIMQHMLNLRHQLAFKYLIFYWVHFLLLALILVIIYQLVISRASKNKGMIGEVFDPDRFQELLKTFSGQNSDASLAYLADKRLYWFQTQDKDQVVFQFAIKHNKCIVMGEPIGNKEYFSLAIESLITEAEKYNMEVIFYEAGQETTLELHEFGYEFIKFGEKAMVPLNHFSLEGRKGKKFRTVLNKLENKGYQFQIITPPFNNEIMSELQLISDDWLQGRREKGYSVGFFNVDYLQRAPIALVKNQEGQIIAFSNLLPTNSKKEASIDLMRYYHNQSQNGVMDYLFIKLLLHFKEEGVAYFDLGMAPLANVGTQNNSFIQEKIAYLIFEFSSRFYSFGGLRQYKQKFSPCWLARYIVYPKKTWLLYDLLAIYLVDSQKLDSKNKTI